MAEELSSNRIGQSSQKSETRRTSRASLQIEQDDDAISREIIKSSQEKSCIKESRVCSGNIKKKINFRFMSSTFFYAKTY